ncbi:DNA cytosine methyltransferase [Chryseobacterium sp. 3008163]|uniref:DNA cytosine methyltransferase n=1 Tax=Chryseobacterium sp. 3008163 TaxID=2478663 RepID=UPI000F0C632E|nr:DNA cytosine methyltransferase [Chryseobacterium sp. 3008163]AYM99378.1 DNA cytosine methyltransferase [Chryseobacterium sp. 3008163]
MPNKTYNFIDLFCGAGGFAKGFEMTGKFKCIGGIDNKSSAIETHKHNFKDSISICDDIRNVPPEEFEKLLNGQKVDLIIGGPPCPTFSTIGHAKIQSVYKEHIDKDITNDPRNDLFLDFFNYVDYFRPKMFVMENVPQFLTKYKGATFNAVKEIIKRDLPEYDLVEEVKVLNSVNYGVPQNRRRMILVGYLKGINFKYPEITHWFREGKFNINPNNTDIDAEKLEKHISVKSAISDLPKITDNWRVSEVEYSKQKDLDSYQKLMRKNSGTTVKNNICRLTNERAKIVFSHMYQGCIYMDLPPEIRKVLPFREDIFKDRLKRLVEENPSWTVLAHIGMDGYMYIHPTEDRTLSVREAARIQSFPDDFVFIGNQQETYMQVGNAVPPLMAMRIAESVFESIINQN